MRIAILEPKMNVNLIQSSAVFVLSTEEIFSEPARVADRHARAALELMLNARLAVS